MKKCFYPCIRIQLLNFCDCDTHIKNFFRNFKLRVEFFKDSLKKIERCKYEFERNSTTFFIQPRIPKLPNGLTGQTLTVTWWLRHHKSVILPRNPSKKIRAAFNPSQYFLICWECTSIFFASQLAINKTYIVYKSESLYGRYTIEHIKIRKMNYDKKNIKRKCIK